MQKLSIGQMAELNRVSKQTLRLYDREGLLVPAFTEEETGYRYYYITQSARLDFIQYLKTYGMTLKQIGELLEGNGPGSVKELLDVQIKEMDRQIDNLGKSRDMILRTLDNYKRYEALPKDGRVFLEFIPEREIYIYKCEEDFFAQDDAGYEYMLRKLKHDLLDKGIHLSYFCNIGTIIRRHHFEKKELFSDEIFVFVDEDESGQRNTERTPDGMYMCMCSSDFNAEADNANKLFDAVRSGGYKAAGDYLCEVIIDFPMPEFDHRQMFYKIQVPVVRA
ncbi:MAG: MerR family transcriptional regulator [Eubacteriaceae bacterium]|nr:MerR family transcriptional regulator [Eubacteriaceae bacterium]